MKFEVKEIKLMNGEKVEVVVQFYQGYSHIGPVDGGWGVYHNRKSVGWINYEAMEILKQLPSDPNDYQPLIDYQNGWDAGRNSILDEVVESKEAEVKLMEEEKFAATVLEAANLQVQGPCPYESEEDKAGFCKTTSVEEDEEYEKAGVSFFKSTDEGAYKDRRAKEIARMERAADKVAAEKLLDRQVENLRLGAYGERGEKARKEWCVKLDALTEDTEDTECHDDYDTESSGCCGGGCHEEEAGQPADFAIRVDSAIPVRPSTITSNKSSFGTSCENTTKAIDDHLQIEDYLQEACDLIYEQSGIKNLELWNETMKNILYKTIKKISDLKEK